MVIMKLMIADTEEDEGPDAVYTTTHDFYELMNLGGSNHCYIHDEAGYNGYCVQPIKVSDFFVVFINDMAMVAEVLW